MSAKEIRTAIKAHVTSAIAGAWAMPNVPEPGALPRYEFEMVAADRIGLLAPGEGVRENGRFQLTAVTDAGEGEGAALTMADALAGAVPDGLWLTFASGRLRIMGPPSARPGYRDGPEWRVPVLVKYTAYLP